MIFSIFPMTSKQMPVYKSELSSTRLQKLRLKKNFFNNNFSQFNIFALSYHIICS